MTLDLLIAIIWRISLIIFYQLIGCTFLCVGGECTRSLLDPSVSTGPSRPAGIKGRGPTWGGGGGGGRRGAHRRRARVLNIHPGVEMSPRLSCKPHVPTGMPVNL